MNLIIKSEAIHLLEKSKTDNPFIKDIIAISKDGFSGSDDNLDSFTNAALLVINEQSHELHEKRSNAGKRSAFVRLSNAEKPLIDVPIIATPTQLGPWSASLAASLVIASNQRMAIRYILFRRNYSMAEEEILFNTFCKGADQVANASELIGKAQTWDNYGRPPFCPIPQLYNYFVETEPKFSSVLRGHLLNKKIQFIPKSDGDGYNVCISADLWQAISPGLGRLGLANKLHFHPISNFA